MPANIINKNIDEEMKTSYLNYAMSVIISRALPDVRDGLKPVHRRILYVMHKMNLTAGRAYKKSAAVVGDVLGQYHPHGDQSVYDALVRMAQDFSMRVPLIDGQGNFGSIDGDSAAAMRYTETRMQKITEQMLRDIEKETVDYQNNYDDSKLEPTVLPSVYPNLLINGASGIAVGMATSVPPHNLVNVIDSVIYYIKNRDCTITDLINIIQAPDFPTGGTIYQYDGVLQGYKTGRGIFKVRGKVQVEMLDKSREALIITEIPYQVNKAELVKKIDFLSKSDILKGVHEVRDESGKEGIRVIVEMKRGSHAQVILNKIYKHTQLENSFSINSLAIVNKVPKLLNLKEIIEHFVSHRIDIITRRTQFDLKKAEEREHIVAGLIKAVQNIDEVIKIIRGSETVELARDRLIERFKFTEKQSKAILEIRLSRLVALEIKKLEEELAELKEKIKEYKYILSNPSKIDEIITEELTSTIQSFGNKRLTEINKSDLRNLSEDDFIEKDTVVISLSKQGYIKRTTTSIYREQRRGGVGVKITASNRDDIPKLVFSTTTHDVILFFSNKGKAYYIKAYEIMESSRTAKGTHIKMLLNLDVGEEIEGYMTFPDFENASHFMIVTAMGRGKKGTVKDLINAKKRGVQAINLRDSDRLISAFEVKTNEDVMVFTHKGNAIRFHESQVRNMGRTAGGVKVINVGSSDQVIGAKKVVSEAKIVTISEKGIGKKIDFSQFSNQSRGGRGVRYMKVNEKTGRVAGINAISVDESLLTISSSGAMIRVASNEIPLLSRTAQGVKMVNVKKPDIVIEIAVITPLEEVDNQTLIHD